ncbi:hypothetical protein [Acinetobacter sp. YH12086]|uniref:hypothetical protein n=1 Tax=Acinetobacter sp. YH12086 TaxID=2601078 RepID=UPI0015D1CE82|nr:hypothetical protein [Acinetobacter sp. YH12086]
MIAKILLIISSLLLSILTYLISHEELWLTSTHLFFAFEISQLTKLCQSLIYESQLLFSILIYLLVAGICIIIGKISILAGKTGATDSLSVNSIDIIEPANEYFLPIYLSYILVAISISTPKAFFIIFLMIAILLFFSKTAFFNPVLLILGYRFYHITNSKGLKTLLIIKYDIKNKDDLRNQDNTHSINVKKINEYTYIQF